MMSLFRSTLKVSNYRRINVCFKSNVSATEKLEKHMSGARSAESKRKMKQLGLKERLQGEDREGIVKDDLTEFEDSGERFRKVYLYPEQTKKKSDRRDFFADIHGKQMLAPRRRRMSDFLHLTPSAIKRRCEAIKQFSTPWPENVTDERCDSDFPPLTFFESDYVRDPIATLKVKLNSLKLNRSAKERLIRLVGTRYNSESDIVTIITDRCPTRAQNRQYAMYLLAALFHESWKFERLESEISEHHLRTHDCDGIIEIIKMSQTKEFWSKWPMAISFLKLAHSQSSNCSMQLVTLSMEGNIMHLKRTLLLVFRNEDIYVDFDDDTTPTVFLSKGNVAKIIDQVVPFEFSEDEEDLRMEMKIWRMKKKKNDEDELNRDRAGWLAGQLLMMFQG